jgi:hypothetical protein
MEGLPYAYDITHDLRAAIAAGAPGIFRYNTGAEIAYDYKCDI